MADTPKTDTRTRRRRSDALRSLDAIVKAARAVLGERPDASMVDIAAAAGITRQTVYAHFASREALVGAVIDEAGAETRAAIEAAHLDTRPPVDALGVFVDIAWQVVDRNPHLLDAALGMHAHGNDLHQPVVAVLERLIRRGQETGNFDCTFDAAWLAAAVVGLGQTAAEQVSAGRFAAAKARDIWRESTYRLCGASRIGS